MAIILIVLISVLIGLFVVDIVLGFISGIIDSRRQAELEQRLCSIETLLSVSVDDCQAIGFDITKRKTAVVLWAIVRGCGFTKITVKAVRQ